MMPKTHSPFVRSFYFWIGIIATFAYRIVIFLTGVDPLWLKVAWYIGTIGFVIYFIHRYQISELRSRLIKENGLVAKINNLEDLNAQDKAAMEYIFQTLQSTREKWNYIFIFVASAIALVAAVYLDFIAR
ncbi:MAG TPA: hypothetical protein VLE93_00855 [Candidatus Saccharimonadales bacterium]|nr:hypothetical protein [Candidatus Saccharimonadales bacterium]